MWDALEVRFLAGLKSPAHMCDPKPGLELVLKRKFHSEIRVWVGAVFKVGLGDLIFLGVTSKDKYYPI